MSDIPDELLNLLEEPEALPESLANSKNPFVKEASNVAVEYVLQKMLDINPKSWNDLKQKGVIPNKASYATLLNILFNYYRKSRDLKERQLSRSSDSEEGSTLEKLQQARIIQEIKLNKARELDVHVKIQQTKGTLLNKFEIFNLISPVMGGLVNILYAAALEKPEFQEIVDKVMFQVQTLGHQLIQLADEDAEEYLNIMCNSPLDLDKILADSVLDITDES